MSSAPQDTNVRQRLRTPAGPDINGRTSSSAVKHGTKSRRSPIRTAIMVLTGSFIGYLLYIGLILESPIDPVNWSMPTPPSLGSNLDTSLAGAERILEGKIKGPESMVMIDGALYASTYPGIIAKIMNDQIVDEFRLVKPVCDLKNCSHETEKENGRPLGMKLTPENKILVADAYKGVFLLDPKSRVVEQLLPLGDVIDGHSIKFLNDAALLADGRILLSESSNRFEYHQASHMLLEGQSDSRLISYDPKTKQYKVLLRDLSMANGLTVTNDGSAILLSNGMRAQIIKYHLSGPMAGTSEIWADNLIGLPDNISPAPNGAGYWVGFAFSRSKETGSPADDLANSKQFRMFIAKLFSAKTLIQLSDYLPVPFSSIALFDETGKVVRSMFDPKAERIYGVSEVLQSPDGYLYLGSHNAPYLGKLKYDGEMK